MELCERYINENDIVYKHLIDYASYLAHYRPMEEVDIPVDELEKHFFGCEECQKRIRNWLVIFENSDERVKRLEEDGKLPSLEDIKADLKEELLDEARKIVRDVKEKFVKGIEEWEVMQNRSIEKVYGESGKVPVLCQGTKEKKESELIGAFPFIEKINDDEVIISIAIFIMENNYTILVGISKEVNLKARLILNSDTIYSVEVPGYTEDDGDIVFSNIPQGKHSLKIGEILEYKLDLQEREVSCK